MPDDAYMPLGNLPVADPTVLLDPPLELAVAEIRFLGAGTPLDTRLGLALKSALAKGGSEFTRMEPVRQGKFELQLQPGAQPESRVQEVVSGWQFQDGHGHLQVTVLPESLTVQTTRYERWSTSLRPVLQEALEAVREIIGPDGVSRIGLRYIDRFTDRSARSPAAWQSRIHDSLLGPVCHPTFGSSVTSAQQQVELAFGPTTGSLLRHGPFVDAAEDGAVSFLLDIDVYDTEPRVFAINEVLDRAQVLNRTAYALFHTSLTPEYLRELAARAAILPPRDEPSTDQTSDSKGARQ